MRRTRVAQSSAIKACHEQTRSVCIVFIGDDKHGIRDEEVVASQSLQGDAWLLLAMQCREQEKQLCEAEDDIIFRQIDRRTISWACFGHRRCCHDVLAGCALGPGGGPSSGWAMPVCS